MSDTLYTCIRCRGEFNWEVLTSTPEGNLFCPPCWKQFKNEPKRKCPVDSVEMTKRRLADAVLIDVCETCRGVWLDKNELETLLKNAKDDGWTAGFILGGLLF
ncbi:MAG TPA: zf-TFIIB domain-containing protein [Pyrinomonadaceae bacterium]|nr:zf-TFIIB domain-containing protein [Pyrinomonadaceae bacterium]